MDYLVFDLETELQRGPLNLDHHIPGITIAATLTSDGISELWYEQDPEGRPRGGALSQTIASGLVSFLLDAAQTGRPIVTWNGSGFDFRVLAHASGRMDDCVDLAWTHIDLMFWLHCIKGFSVGLAKAAEAAGSGKTPGISGADAPRLWAAGEYELVKAYVTQDVRALAAVYEAAVQAGELRWINSARSISAAPGRLLAVQEACKLPLPDTSWMRRRSWPREKFVGWMSTWRGQHR